jgi:hypothetical protein
MAFDFPIGMLHDMEVFRLPVVIEDELLVESVRGRHQGLSTARYAPLLRLKVRTSGPTPTRAYHVRNRSVEYEVSIARGSRGDEMHQQGIRSEPVRASRRVDPFGRSLARLANRALPICTDPERRSIVSKSQSGRVRYVRVCARDVGGARNDLLLLGAECLPAAGHAICAIHQFACRWHLRLHEARATADRPDHDKCQPVSHPFYSAPVNLSSVNRSSSCFNGSSSIVSSTSAANA